MNPAVSSLPQAAPPGAPLLERDGEVAALADALADAAAGRGRAVTIEGPPGLGKTSLVEAAAEAAAARGMRAVVARGSELEREFAFGVVRQLLEPLVAEGGTAMFQGAAEHAATLFASAQERSRGADSTFAVL